MPTPNFFQPSTILRVIFRAGHNLQVCEVVESQSAKPEWGVLAQTELQCRPVRGYAVPEESLRHTAINAKSQLQSGEYVAFISAEDIEGNQLTGSTTFLWEGRQYAPSYLESIRHQGVPVLVLFRLQSTQDNPSIRSNP